MSSVVNNHMQNMLNDIASPSENNEMIDCNKMDANISSGHNNSILNNIATDFLDEVNNTTSSIKNNIEQVSYSDVISPTKLAKLQKYMMERNSTLSFGSKVVGSITKGIDSLIHTQ
jgi:hypothetical protein